MHVVHPVLVSFSHFWWLLRFWLKWILRKLDREQESNVLYYVSVLRADLLSKKPLICWDTLLTPPTGTALQRFIIAGTTPKPRLISRPTCHMPTIIRPGTIFLTSSPNSPPFEIKTQGNGISCMQLTFLKVPSSKTIHDQLRPLPRSSSLAIFYFPPNQRSRRISCYCNRLKNTNMVEDVDVLLPCFRLILFSGFIAAIEMWKVNDDDNGRTTDKEWSQ